MITAVIPKAIRESDTDLLDQLTGLTGLGWTASVLGYLSTVIGYGNGLISRLVAEPQSLLYVGGSFFLLTLGLDRLQSKIVAERGSEDGGEE
ncbi:hypothetical protein [Halorubrum lipolyticum]|uniref:Uncharacterized protein n=1 Tax=Halorubrum lipolyticum DSM 21995 TaxID=1227482 RepID=M0NNE9_9EURY|nr:hypothetical protein [Halorubrum lipolyticum]EMA58694.1 hypothetical protein C469_12760 [Halorubrum lipolyticum DSM 21995]